MKPAPEPATALVRQFDTHRLIPSRYGDRGRGALGRIADDGAHLDELLDLESATDDRRLAEHDRVPGIGLGELVFGVPNAGIVNAAFCHAQPHGSRFNGPDRGAWYAGFALETAFAEVGFHKRIELAEVAWAKPVAVEYDDYLADFTGRFHDLRRAPAFAACLAPDSYVESQRLAMRLFDAMSLGVVYPSVRHRRGTCIACFRPAAVGNVRKDRRYRFTFAGRGTPKIEAVV